ncbi:M23 family metallopeptidase [Bacillota bacterium LX-D]|nr:M23 family metallopeptidase [Bacillota bacterium LX-D]
MFKLQKFKEKKITNLKFPQLNSLKQQPPFFILAAGIFIFGLLIGLAFDFQTKNTTQVVLKGSAGERVKENVAESMTGGTKEAQESSKEGSPESTSQSIAEKTQETPENTRPKEAAFDPAAMRCPLNGEILQSYGVSYSKSYGDYRLHSGLDIKGAPGAEVVAAYAGTVQKVQQLSGGGQEITLLHDQNWKTVYSSLNTNLTEGTSVPKGAIVGYLNGNNPKEENLQPHLHFELSNNGQPVDPNKYLR